MSVQIDEPDSSSVRALATRNSVFLYLYIPTGGGNAANNHRAPNGYRRSAMTGKSSITFAILAVVCVVGTGCQSMHSGLKSGGLHSHCDSLCCDECPNTGCEETCCDAGICDAGSCDAGSCGDSCCDDFACDAMGYRGNIQIVRGRAYAFLDGFGDIAGVANKVALWDRRADNHNISRSTEQKIARYLSDHELKSTLIRVNQYDPIGEWKRLMANDRIAAGWKYSFGTYDWLKYTLIPGRLVGGDWYNPFTDSIHIYSDIPAIGLAKAAYAKDVHSRELPGTYAAGQDVPLIGMWHEKLANQDVLNYLRRRSSPGDVKEAEKILYPDFGGALGSQVLGFLPYGNVYGRAAGALAGHAVREVKEVATGPTG